MGDAATDRERWFHPRGTLSREGWESVVDGSLRGWEHTGIRVGALADRAELGWSADACERIVVPIDGTFTVTHSGHPESGETVLAGRTSPTAGPTDVLYLPRGASATIRGRGRVAVTEAPARRALPARYLPADRIAVELRGAGAATRQVHDFTGAGGIETDRLLACEVVTPSGNWSSFPPHKHDEDVPGHESRLEEIYYFEAVPARVAPAADATAAFGLFSVSSSPVARIDYDVTVRTGDIALVPHGYHGPAVAAPGTDLYYLNVMAGPGAERAWLITDDPTHAWVRPTWPGLPIDPRLPFTDEEARR